MRQFQLLALVVVLFLGLSYIGGSQITLTGEQKTATFAAVSSSNDPTLRTTPADSGGTDSLSGLKESCTTPGVGCAFTSGNIYPVGDCNPVTAQSLAGCKAQFAIAQKQTTAGVGQTPAPLIIGTQYSSTQCKVSVRLRKGSPVITGDCKPDASQTCPTAQANDKTECFWEDCSGSCLNPSTTSQSDNQTGESAEDQINDITDELQNNGSITGTDGTKYPDIASCKAAGACVDVAQAGGDTTVDSGGGVIPNQGGSTIGGDVQVQDVYGGGTDSAQVPADQLPSGNAGGNQSSSGSGNGPVPSGGNGTPATGNSSPAPVGGSNPVNSGGSNTGQSGGGWNTGAGVGNSTGGYGGTSGGSASGYGSTYQSFQTPKSLAQPQSFIQRFAGYVTGQAALRNTPEGQQGGQPQVIYVTSPGFDPSQYTTVDGVNSYRTVQQIASDISAQTQTGTLARVDHFAQTLNAVGGPSAVSTENKSFGRIQDLIVEDEAIRALRVAEEEGNRAKNQVSCRINEAAESCQARREARAKEVERQVFIEELNKRVLPDNAIQHFLAVYDGWIRPSPAPSSYATSTLALLNAQNNEPAQYEITTGGTNFVLWFIDSVAETAINAVNSVIGLFQ